MARSQLQKLGTYLRPHWPQAALGIGALFVVNVLGVGIPLFIRDGIDELQVTFSFNRVMYYVMLLVLVSASAMWGIRMASRISLFGVGRQVEFDLKQRIFQHLLQMEPAYFDRNTAGELISRATSDVDNIRRLLGFAVLSLANTVFAYALTVPVMLSISVRLTIVALLVYPFMLVLVQMFSHKLRAQQLQVQERISRLSDLIQEDMSGISLIKIYAQEENERRAFNQLNWQLLSANLTLAKTRNTLFPLLGGLASVSLLVVLASGAESIAEGFITVGDFVALLLYVERLVFPTALLGFTITAYQRGEVSIDRVEAILDAEPKIQNAPSARSIALNDIQGYLEARNLTFTYPGSQTPALDNISFSIVPGETIAIVGPIGSGKSTLANALPRLLDIGDGQLFVDNHDVTHILLHDLRRAIAYVPQDSFLFSTSIKNNIRYGAPLEELPEVKFAAKQAQIDAEIGNFPPAIRHYRGRTRNYPIRRSTSTHGSRQSAPSRCPYPGTRRCPVQRRQSHGYRNSECPLGGYCPKNSSVYFPSDVSGRDRRSHFCNGSGAYRSNRYPPAITSAGWPVPLPVGTAPTRSSFAVT
jgi:ATP-binding cassette subfamily B multidrug efflux pump